MPQHDLGVTLKCHFVLFDLTMTKSSHIHNMSRDAFVFLSCFIDIQLIRWLIILRTKFVNWNDRSLDLALTGILSELGWSVTGINVSFKSFPLFILSILPKLNFAFIVFNTPVHGIGDMLNSIFVLLELKTAKSKAIMCIWPLLVNSNCMLEAFQRLLKLI